jgi:hypothetical protein
MTWIASSSPRWRKTANPLRPEADPATLIRRVTLDLTGLLPTPEEVSSFILHPSSFEAYAHRPPPRLPHYGERWGRHWLDLARYADTSGTHNDLDRPHAWKYRDYVIRSFNDDKPYARFVAEQIAGDEIDGANEDSLIATGFCRNGTSNDDNMGKNDDALAQYRADQLDDVISTTSSVFLGLTVGCARCHDHKTDPLLQRDYYSLLAIFNGTEKYGLVPGTQDKNDKRIKIDETAKVHALIETSPQVPVTRIMLRGSALNLGDEVPPAIPTLFKPVSFPITCRQDLAAPQNPRRMDHLSRQRARVACHRQSRLAASLRPGHRRLPQQFRLHRRQAHTSRTARLPRQSAHSKRRPFQTAAQDDPDVGDISAGT